MKLAYIAMATAAALFGLTLAFFELHSVKYGRWRTISEWHWKALTRWPHLRLAVFGFWAIVGLILGAHLAWGDLIPGL
jgi:hypothetical protein